LPDTREAIDRRFAGRVTGNGRKSDGGSHGGHVDNHTAASSCATRAHAPERVLQAQGRSHDIDIQHLAQGWCLDVHHQGRDFNAGVVDDDIQATQFVHRGLHGAFPLPIIRHVQRHKRRSNAFLCQLLRRGAPGIFQHIGQHHRRPCGTQCPGHASAEPASPACDEGRFACQIHHAHDHIPLVC
jgi:hypothetical protein